VIFPSVLSLFFLFYFFEPLSFPGSTRLFAKHAMFFFPIFLYLIVCSDKYISASLCNSFFLTVLISQLIGLSFALPLEKDSWSIIEEDLLAINPNETLLIVEKNSNEILQNKNINQFKIINYSEDFHLEKASTIIFFTSDYKLYTELTLKQNWDQGTSTFGQFNNLNDKLKLVQNGYKLEKSIVSYPKFYYRFEKINPPYLTKKSQYWSHKLKDLNLPSKTADGRIIKSSYLIKSNSYILHPSSDHLILNLEDSENDEKYAIVGKIECGKEVINLVNKQNIWDLFADYKGDNTVEDNLAFSWVHRPLASFSVQYQGSWYRHKAKAYKILLNRCLNEPLKISNLSQASSLRIWNTE